MVRRVRTLAVVGGLMLGLAAGCVSLKPEKQPAPALVPPPDAASVRKTDKVTPYAVVPTGYQVLDDRPAGLAQALHAPELDPEPPTVRVRPPRPTPTVQEPREEESTPRDPGPPIVVKIEPTLDDPVVEALRLLRENRRDEAARMLHELQKPNQEVVLGLLQVAARLSQEDLTKAKPQELAAVIQQLENLVQPLRQRAPVRIDKLCFCDTIRRFGCYEPVRGDPPTFQAAGAGREGELVQVYAEISNFTTRPEGEEFVANLASSFEVRNYDGEVVWSHQFPPKPDRSRSLRRDYFINYWFRIPAALKPGHYTLRVQVQDVLPKSPRPMVWRSLEFRVVAQGSVPGPRAGSSLSSKTGGGGS